MIPELVYRWTTRVITKGNWICITYLFCSLYFYLLFIFIKIVFTLDISTIQGTHQLCKLSWSCECYQAVIKIQLKPPPRLLLVSRYRLWQLKLSLILVNLFLFQAERCSSHSHDQQPYTVSSLPPPERSAPPCSCHVWLFSPVSDIRHCACVTGSITPASDQVKDTEMSHERQRRSLFWIHFLIV